jgi:hypothetical protein
LFAVERIVVWIIFLSIAMGVIAAALQLFTTGAVSTPCCLTTP